MVGNNERRDMAFEALESAASGAIEEGNVGGGGEDYAGAYFDAAASVK